MHDNQTFRFKAWMLPLVVAAIVMPATIGMLIEGPALGLALGAASAVVLSVIGFRMSPEDPIEVAEGDGLRHVLVVAGAAIEEPSTAQQVAERVHADEGDDVDVLVLAPAETGFLDRWASDVRRARHDAQSRLVLSVAALARAHLEAHGRVGDADLLQATEDTLRQFPADEVILVTGPEDRDRGGARAAEQLRRRLDRTLTHVVSDGSGRG
jgi:CTP:molybdopterin cytidylyltransferase MocA